jgi:hypothetical protein
MMPWDVILSGIYWLFPWKKRAGGKHYYQKKGRLVWILLFSYTYSKRTKQANLDSQIAGAKT